MRVVKLDTRRITDWDSFHRIFQEVFGFPAFYGCNMDAWIDCMTSLDEPRAGLSSIHVPPGEVLVLQLDHVSDFSSRCPEQYAAVVECAAFVNWRRIEVGENAILALSFYPPVPTKSDAAAKDQAAHNVRTKG
jgi:Barstar (barnase inhibitor)